MKSKYYLAALLAFGIWGFFSLALKPLFNYRSVDILFYRVFICTLLMLAFNLLFRKKVLKENLVLFRTLSKKNKVTTLSLTFGGGVLLVANWFFFIYVMNNVSIKAASFAYLVCPILTTLLAFFILDEKLGFWQWLAVGLSVISCGLLSFHNFTDVFYSLIVAVTYAFYLITQRKNAGFDKFLVLSCQIFFAALILLPFYAPFGSNMGTDTYFYLRVLVIAIGFTILPLFLNLYALQGLKSSTIGILLYINPLINFLIALFYYHEPINHLQLIAYLFILISIVMFNARHIFKKTMQH